MVPIDIEKLKVKFADYPHVLRYIRFQVKYFVGGWEVLKKLQELKDGDLRKGRILGCKNFKDLNRRCARFLRQERGLEQPEQKVAL